MPHQFFSAPLNVRDAQIARRQRAQQRADTFARLTAKRRPRVRPRDQAKRPASVPPSVPKAEFDELQHRLGESQNAVAELERQERGR